MSTQFITPARRNYLPINEEQSFLWLLNFKTELPRFSNIYKLDPDLIQQLSFSTLVYEHTREYAANAFDVYHERIANKNQAAWNPVGKELLIRPFTARLNLANNETSTGGALTYAVQLADQLLQANPTADVKDALRLN
ncbi:MAG: hypothetical protein LBK71_06595, partial [Verrucomicrobiales bacterium]|nr:hypothetical protein [Verrucomicrobiales bacterium]